MTDANNARWLRRLLFAVVIVLTFEGVARKAVPSALRIPLFFLKDMLVMAMAVFVFRMTISAVLQPIWNAFLVVCALMVVPIFMTACHDPFLAIFGAKQYLLFPMVGLATFLAFEKSPMDQVLSFYRWTSLLVIPTALLAFVQSHLPHDHWLNMSISGDTMEAFGAGGELRVSSTFSFNAQYCAFLNAQIFIVMVAMQGWAQRSLLWKITSVSLLPLIVFSSFVTGSRGAVVGNLSIILLAFGISSLKFQVRDLLKIGLVMCVLYLGLLGLQHFDPKALAAYSVREDGRLIGFSEEVRGRMFGSVFGVWGSKSNSSFLGHGLGVMSNGTDVFSNYAAGWRARMWTETDIATTLFEGGYYLVFVWYGFRLFIIFHTLRLFLTEMTPEFSSSTAFCQAFIVVIGLFGTLALQPPIAIWWWLGVGTLLVFYWKSIAPADAEIVDDKPAPPPPAKKIRGRSLYADMIHSRK